MADSLVQNLRRLGQRVGAGDLEGAFHVDGGERTVPLEVGYWRNFMGRYGRVDIRNYNDGGPHAAQRALEATYEMAMQDIAKTTLSRGPQEAMERHVERVDRAFKWFAPRRTGQYRDSTLRVVLDRGRPTFVRRGAFYGRDPGE